jgi:hypothetical protein
MSNFSLCLAIMVKWTQMRQIIYVLYRTSKSSLCCAFFVIMNLSIKGFGIDSKQGMTMHEKLTNLTIKAHYNTKLPFASDSLHY